MYHRGENLPFLVIAIALAAYAVLAAFLINDRPGRPVPDTPLLTRLTQAARLRVTWELSALDAIGFGGSTATICLLLLLTAGLGTASGSVFAQAAHHADDAGEAVRPGAVG
ncbi:hypothetical protein ACE1SV_44180 [Streptomyces sp. E-15]